MKRKIAILLLLMIFVISITSIAYASGDDDLNSWKKDATANSELSKASSKISSLGLAVKYIFDNGFKMILSIVVSFVSTKLLFAKNGHSADTSKQMILSAVFAVLIYVLGVPILNMLAGSFSTVFH